MLFYVEAEDPYKEIQEHLDGYDFIEYPVNISYYSTENKKIVGKFKDERMGKLFAELVGLRPKMYSVMVINGKNKLIAKGAQKALVEKDFRHKLYKQSRRARVSTYV